MATETQLKELIRGICPPIIYSRLALIKSLKNKRGKTCWQTVKNGLLQDRQLFLSTSKDSYSERMIEGTYDLFMFEYLKIINPNGTVIFDIGSHIGYHALSFANIVGEKGCVYAFEPNIHNLARLHLNLTRNQDLAARIKVFDIAVSDRTGKEAFYFSDDLQGKSSGSFISGADTYYPKTESFLNSFKKTIVKTDSLDKLYNSGKIPQPHIIKIDVEGAESAVVQGAFHLIEKYNREI